MMASFSPVSCCACFSRDEYGFRSTNFSGSVDAISPSKVSYWLSSSNRASRVRASIRKCLSHFGQTFMFSSRSFFQMICRQPSHFTHNPSVLTRFSPEVSSSPDSRLNQAIKTVASTEYRVPSKPAELWVFSVLGTRYSVLYASLRHHAFFIRVLDLAHFGHCIGSLDNCGVRVPARQDNVHHLRLLLQALDHPGRVQHAVTDGIVDLIEHHQIPLPRLNRVVGRGPGLLNHACVFRVRFLRAHLHKAPAHLLHDKLVAEGLHRVEFAVVPRALQELQHEHPHP